MKYLEKLDSLALSRRLLIQTLSGVVLSLILSATIVWSGKSNLDTLEEIYEFNVVPLDKLRKIQLLFREIEYRMAAVMSEMSAPIGAAEHLKISQAEIDQLWQDSRERIQSEQLAELKSSFEQSYGIFRCQSPSAKCLLRRRSRSGRRGNR